MRASPSTLRNARGPRGQTIVEFALVYSLILLPLTFMIVFVSQMLWVWHSVAEWTRAGAKYAATHCFQSGGENVKQWMRNNVPPMVDINKFRDGEVDINVDYFSQDPATGDLVAFTCSGTECSPECVPDAVHVSVSNYEFTRFFNVLGLPPVTIPDFSAAVSMEGAGCNPEQQTCLP